MVPSIEQESKILLVGVGGVGSEILKNLALSGFTYISLVDLDTIEVSNLNRQLFFRKTDVGQLKAEVAAEYIKRFYKETEEINISCFCKSIFEEEFSAVWFEQFDIVINALDNIEARLHVNRMCRQAEIPLVETGTAGYYGNSDAFVGQACYECFAPRSVETIPVCSIRMKPENLNHTIHWGKYLFKQYFDCDESDENNEPKFIQDGQKELKKTFEDTFGFECRKGETKILPLQTHQYFTVHDNKGLTNIWVEAFEKLQQQKRSKAQLKFDKDDNIAMAFVYASANLRNDQFKIEKCSFWTAKSKAGNIIPAIATSNSIIAAAAVIQATNILAKDYLVESVRLTDYFYENTNLLRAYKLADKREDCRTCKQRRKFQCFLNYDKISLYQFACNSLSEMLTIDDLCIVYNTKVILSCDYKEDEDMRFYYEKPFSSHSFPEKMIWIVKSQFENTDEYAFHIHNESSVEDVKFDKISP